MLDRAQKNQECWDRLCFTNSQQDHHSINNNNNNNLADCPDAFATEDSECPTTKKTKLDISNAHAHRMKNLQDSVKTNGHHNISNGHENLHKTSIHPQTKSITTKNNQDNNVTSTTTSTTTTKSSLSTSQLFPCISEGLVWATQGRDVNLATLSQKNDLCSSGVPEFLKNAGHIQVLVTGSLLLVGGVLTVVDPHMND